jgi:catechol 2,3-dioxygenase-like lactoylglutathione lyase family enzyme
MADFQKVVPVLKVSDMQKSVAFYTGVLGFRVAWRAANDGDGENFMLQAGSGPAPSTGSHLGGAAVHRHAVLHLAVREFFERVKNQAEVVWPLETMDYGRRVRRRDCDGYTLAFAEAPEGSDRRPDHFCGSLVRVARSHSFSSGRWSSSAPFAGRRGPPA